MIKSTSTLIALVLLASASVAAQASNCSDINPNTVITSLNGDDGDQRELLSAIFPLMRPALNEYSRNPRTKDSRTLRAGLQTRACEPVIAMTSGTVERVNLYYMNTISVTVRLATGDIVQYSHLDSNVNVKKGDAIVRGQVIGQVGNSSIGDVLQILIIKEGFGDRTIRQLDESMVRNVDNILMLAEKRSFGN